MKRLAISDRPSQTNPQIKPLLVQRSKAAALLGCCPMTLIRLEQKKAITPVRLSKRAGRVYYRMEQIEKLAESGLQ